MAVSLLLLSVLISNWLASQYKEQKQQLQKNLEDDLANAKKEVSDSLLYYNLIKPVLNMSTLTSDIDAKVDIGKASGRSHVKIVLGADNDTDKIKEIAKKLSKMQIGLEKKINIHEHSEKEPKKIYKIKAPQVSQDILKQGVAMIMEEIFQQTGISGDSAFTLDTAHLRKSFNKKLDNKNLHFTTIWNEDTYRVPRGKNKMIFIGTDYLSRNYNVAINDYSGYIIKKMLPQMLFSLTLLFFVATAFYISLRSLKQQMRLSTMKNELISNMSHELKTPISTVKVALEALTTFNAAQNPQTTKDYLEMASHEMNRLDMLVNQTLNISLLEEGKIVIRKECIDLQKLSNHIAQMLQMRLQQYGATLHIETKGIEFTTQADPLHIQGVIMNMIDNSLKYANSTPLIKIIVDSTGQMLNVSVADNGPGIPKEHLNHVFDKFYRVPHGDRHNVKGYGLGLSYSKQVALQHDGKITAQNLTLGGCVFTLSLPKIPC